MAVNVTELWPLPAPNNNYTTSTYPTIKLFPYTIIVTRSHRKNDVTKTEEERIETKKFNKKRTEKKLRMSQAMKKPTQKGEFNFVK